MVIKEDSDLLSYSRVCSLVF